MEVFEIITIILIILILLIAVAAVVSTVTAYKKGIELGIERRKQTAEAQFGSAEERAKAIVSEAERTA
jgi:ribonuclease Y